MLVGETLEVTKREGFRRWLAAHHKTRNEIWLVQYKKAAHKPSINYVDAVEEALCFGWIDSMEKSLDKERFATRFTRRRPKSNWTDANKDRARKLIAAGKMRAAGYAALPPDVLEPPARTRSKRATGSMRE
jgi:uncharacterized protein YdeI (YjbR/CyaY-like superfamily)